ncbi:hypothetical protein EVAR_88211_1, partial [Eumeta japonica]
MTAWRLRARGDHKAHYDITVTGDFDQFDRKPIEIISPSLSCRHRRFRPARFCVLYIFAFGSYQRALATGHCVSQQALSKYIKEVTDALTNISERYIQFPNTTQERNAVKQ